MVEVKLDDVQLMIERSVQRAFQQFKPQIKVVHHGINDMIACPQCAPAFQERVNNGVARILHQAGITSEQLGGAPNFAEEWDRSKAREREHDTFAFDQSRGFSEPTRKHRATTLF